MTELVRYEAAKAALAECRRIDEAKDLRDRAEAMRHYARQARDVQLEIDAWEIRVRAERRLGEMIAAQKETIGLHRGGRPKTGSAPEPVSVPTLAEAGIDKKLSAAAQKVASISEQAFEAMVERRRAEMAVERNRRTLVLASREDKTERRAARERDLAARQRALPDRRYGVIYADPEWRFEPRSRESGMDRAADNHYPTSSTDAIAARPVAAIAADDCVLFIWATVPMLPDALRVMSAWGFAYKSHAIWFKDRVGTGYWFRNAHELLLVGTRGQPPAPAMGGQFSSVIEAPIGAHSAKPDDFRELIETYFPTLPKIELNARTAREGWDTWGNEAPDAPEQADCDGKTPSANSANENLDSTGAFHESIDPETGEILESLSETENVDASLMGADGYETFGSRPVAGRTATATSENMEVTAGETATQPSSLDIPEFLRRQPKPAEAVS